MSIPIKNIVTRALLSWNLL